MPRKFITHPGGSMPDATPQSAAPLARFRNARSLDANVVRRPAQRPRRPPHRIDRTSLEGQNAAGAILDRLDVTPNLVVLRIAKPEGFSFEPGQYVKIGVDGVRRKYSIASPPRAPHLELCIERVVGGRLTSRLWRLHPGDRVEVSDRGSGKLRLADDEAHVMFATVTGVAPFASMLRDALPRSRSRFVLVHGARHAAELVLSDELEALADQHADRFTYLPCVTRPEPGWTGRIGRVTAHVDEAATAAGERFCGYACGHPDMVREVATAIESRGLEVRTEAYWS